MKIEFPSKRPKVREECHRWAGVTEVHDVRTRFLESHRSQQNFYVVYFGEPKSGDLREELCEPPGHIRGPLGLSGAVVGNPLTCPRYVETRPVDFWGLFR